MGITLSGLRNISQTLFIHGHRPLKPDTQFASPAPATFRKPLCSHKVAFKETLALELPFLPCNLP
jgi:hypothetical protein